LRRIDDHGYWITIPSFSTSDATSGAALKKLTEQVVAAAPSIRDSKLVVFDVRGNRGGSSSTGVALLAAIWGEPFVESRSPRSKAIDWQLSPGNLRFLRDGNLRALRRQFGDDSPQAKGLAEQIQSMSDALARGEVFYRQMPEPPAAVPLDPAVRVRPVLLTDNVCASACLDFADVVLNLSGAQHFGRETSADAIYIDNRAMELPSGLGPSDSR
jgi:hypothetical protein